MSTGERHDDGVIADSVTFEDALLSGFHHFTRVRRKRRIIMTMKTIMVMMLLTALGLALWLPVSQYVNARSQRADAAAALNHVAKWPQGKVADEFHRAQRYNAAIAASGQQSLGEYADPFIAKANRSGAPARSEKDDEYRTLLDEGNGVMGVVEIPQISLKLPIYHGTSDAVLNKGVGHLYGTSLPVGGASTNSVLSGHRGKPHALLFTRLDELKVGDAFYVETLNRMMGYRIVAIHVVLPKDTHLYKVVPGRDLVTLMTCTPYGVNSHRLVLTAERRPIPQDIPYPDDAYGDGLLWGVLVGTAIALVGIVVLAVRHRRHHMMRHAMSTILRKA